MSNTESSQVNFDGGVPKMAQMYRSNEKKLWEACRDGDLSEVNRLLLNTSVDINYQDDWGMTPVSGAAFHGQTDIVKLLVEAGADVNIKDMDGWTPVTYAAERDHTEVVKLLVEAGADLNIKGYLGCTPLSRAVMAGDTEVLKLLIEAGADPNIKMNLLGRTPVSYAAGHGHTEIIKLLVEAGADLNIKDVYGRSPYDFAMLGGRRSVADYIKALQESKLAEQMQKASLDDKKTGN